MHQITKILVVSGAAKWQKMFFSQGAEQSSPVSLERKCLHCTHIEHFEQFLLESLSGSHNINFMTFREPMDLSQ